jgi:SAM-dependent methyltransferase
MFIQEFKKLLSYYTKHNVDFAKHDYEDVFLGIVNDLCKHAEIEDFRNKKILELGCGQHFTNCLLFANVGAKVTGLDIDYVSQENKCKKFVKTINQNGLKRAMKSLIRQIVFDPSYYKTIEQLSGLGISSKNISFIIYDPLICNYPLEEEKYDLILNIAVLEHVKDVDLFAREIFRLLKLNGVFHIFVHNYYSISGGHDLKWAFPDSNPPENSIPWEHLRTDKKVTWVNLNRYKPDEYLDTFQKYFEILHFEGRGINHKPNNPEGEKFLTTEVEKELSQYSKELLLTRAYCIIGRKQIEKNNENSID